MLRLAILALGPATAQETGERTFLRELRGLIADARTGAGWTAALQPYPVVRLDSLLRRHGLDLRGQDPRRSAARVASRERPNRPAPAPRPDRLTLEEAVQRMERDIERWILRAGPADRGIGGSPGQMSEGPPPPVTSPPPGTEGGAPEPPGGGGLLGHR